MKRRRHTPEQAVRKIRGAKRLLNEGQDLVEVLRHLEVSEAMFNRWRATYGGMKADEILLREGWTINRKRARRIWRQEGLRRPVRTCKHRRVGTRSEATVARHARRSCVGDRLHVR